ncbi:MAG TPA: winged helix-turn-helix domain-containing protein [Terriglobales bacterium]|nr:winged helix-turn-helix domain-containing protein [Terriglobales bacterium]
MPPVHFGQFSLDVERYELTCVGRPVRLERIPMDLLILLVREGGRLVRREEIIERLWGKGVFFDTDNSINTAIRKIRRALGEDPEKPQYIETVLGKGYRFKTTQNPSAGPLQHSLIHRPEVMLAILPFENLSGDPSQEYFSDGLTEETIMRLGQMAPDRLGVIARTSSMAYKRTDKSIRKIGEELGVDYILEGSVRRESDRVRVTAQLIRVQDQIHLWAENFDRPPHSMLDIHGEVGAAIASQVRIKLTAEEKSQLKGARHENHEAHDLYLRGRYHHAKVTYPELQKAVGYFQKAIALDPEYVLAYSGLAESYVRFPITSDIASRDAFPYARAAVDRALQVDPNSAEAHGSDAAIKFWYEWDFAAAEAAARKAIALNANYWMAYLWLGHVLSNVGRHDEALPAIQQAHLLDPFSLIANTMYGQFLYQAGRVEDSVRQFQSTLELEPRFWVAQICAAKSYESLARYDEALAACERAWEFSGGNSEALSLAGYVYAVSGNQEKAEAKIKELQEQKLRRYVPPYNFALIFAGLGDTESALHWLEQAVEDRDVHMAFLRDHKWNVLRSEPRFGDILSQCGFSGALSVTT